MTTRLGQLYTVFFVGYKMINYITMNYYALLCMSTYYVIHAITYRLQGIIKNMSSYQKGIMSTTRSLIYRKTSGSKCINSFGISGDTVV